MSAKSRSLVIHIKSESDEFFHTDSRNEILDLIKKLYADKLKKNLPIFSPSQSDLDKFWTTEKEAEKGFTRMPKIETALESENIVIEENEAKLDETSDAKQEEVWLEL